jgi:hypothetical protein
METTTEQEVTTAEDDDSDSKMWDLIHQAKRASRDRKRNAMYNISERLKILDRVEFVNEGTCLLDGKFYYYAQKKKARVKGKNKYYTMRGFQHFIDVFCEPIDLEHQQQSDSVPVLADSEG